MLLRQGGLLLGAAGSARRAAATLLSPLHDAARQRGSSAAAGGSSGWLAAGHWAAPNASRQQRGCCVAAAAAEPQQPAQPAQPAEQLAPPPVAAAAAAAQEWAVLNFYHLVDIPDPDEMLARHKAFIAERGLDSICGRIYISAQGINCQGGGTKQHTQEYVAWVAAQPEFQGLFHTLWPADGPMFPRLRLKLKPNLISLAGGMAGLPCTDAAMRATPLQPAEWRARMAAAQAVNAAVEAGTQAPSKRVVVMDLRNDYEWDAGHFDWAPRPDEEVFAETPVPVAHATSEDAADASEAAADAAAAAAAAEDVPSPLQGADPDNTEVLMYCTGGIRCDVYSALLRQKGFKNLYTLHGGIQNYLAQEGNEHWNGSLFVFDGRLAINPALQGPGADKDTPLPAAVPCQLCGAEAVLPHVNCANMDCNELFIACTSCKTKFHGCCCEACQSAPRLLRPIKLGGGNYGAWNNYADAALVGPVISTGRSREGRVARRARRRQLMTARRQAAQEQRQQLKAAMKAAIRAAEAAKAAAVEPAEHAQGAARS